MSGTDQQLALFCPRCDYNLTGLSENRCPECGEAFDLQTANERRDQIKDRSIWRLIGCNAGAFSAVTLLGTILLPPWAVLLPMYVAIGLLSVFNCWRMAGTFQVMLSTGEPSGSRLSSGWITFLVFALFLIGQVVLDSVLLFLIVGGALVLWIHP